MHEAAVKMTLPNDAREFSIVNRHFGTPVAALIGVCHSCQRARGQTASSNNEPRREEMI